MIEWGSTKRIGPYHQSSLFSKMKEQMPAHWRLVQKVLRLHWANEVGHSNRLFLHSFLLGQDRLKNPTNLVRLRLNPFLDRAVSKIFWWLGYEKVDFCVIFSPGYFGPREMVQFPRRFVGHWACLKTPLAIGGSSTYIHSWLTLSYIKKIYRSVTKEKINK